MPLTRSTLNVPDPVAATSMNLGAPWLATPFNGSGLTVNTDGKVWLDARGETSTSTFSALSNGAEGQLLLQAIHGHLVCVSQESAIITSNEGALFAGGGGVKLIAGHGAPVFFGTGNDSLNHVTASDEVPKSQHVKDYTDHVDHVAKWWTVTDTIVAVALTALDVVLVCVEAWKGTKLKAELGTVMFAAGSLANLAGGTANMMGTGGEDVGQGDGENVFGMDTPSLPGLQIHAFSNINFCTTGFCSMYAGAGLLLFGGTTAGLGFATAGMVGFVSASLKSLAMCTVEGSKVELSGDGVGDALSLSARTGMMHLDGKTIQVGSNLPEVTAAPQSPTLTLEAVAVKELHLKGLAVEVNSTGTVEFDAGTIEVDGTQEVTISNPTYTVKVTAAGIDVVLNSTVKVTMDSQALTADMSGAQQLKLDARSIKIGSAATVVEASVDGLVAMRAPLVTLAQ